MQFFAQMMKLEELGTTGPPLDNFRYGDADYNSSDDEFYPLLEFEDREEKKRRTGFKRFGWCDDAQRFDSYF